MYLVLLDNNDETAGCFVTERSVKKIKRTRIPCVPSKTTRHARRVFERETRLAIDARVLCVRASATSHTRRRRRRERERPCEICFKSFVAHSLEWADPRGSDEMEIEQTNNESIHVLVQDSSLRV